MSKLNKYGGIGLGVAGILLSVTMLWSQTRFTAHTGTVTTVAPQTLFNVGDGRGGSLWMSPEGRLLEARTLPTGPLLSLEQVKLTARAVPSAALAPAAYMKLAMRIKLESAGIDEARVLDALHQLDMKTYDYDRVDEYLYRQALKQGTQVRWVWKPMRDSDMESIKTSSSFGVVTQGFGMLFYKLYGKAIPARVLNTAETILAKVPDALFLVSDYEVLRPDPFLAVTTKKLIDENKLWIIDVWAEPGFGEQVPEMKIGPIL